MNLHLSVLLFMPFFIEWFVILFVVIVLLFFVIIRLLHNKKELQSLNLINEAVWKSTQGYLFLVDTTGHVKRTNYYALKGLPQPKGNECFGKVINCKYAQGDGLCGFSGVCADCPICRHVRKHVFEEKGEFSDMEVKLDIFAATKSKEIHSILLSASYLNFEGSDYALLTIQDVSKEKVLERSVRKSNQKFSSVFSNLPVGCAICDKSGIAQEVNDAYLEYLGVNSRDDIIGKLNIFNNPCINESYKEMMRKGIPIFEEVKYEYDKINKLYIKSRHKSVKYYRFIVDYLFSRNKEIESYVIIWVDNTLIHNTLKQNKRFNDMVSFASSVSNIGFGSVNIMRDEQVATPEYLNNLGGTKGDDIRTLFSNFNNVHPDDRTVLMDYWARARKQRTEPIEKDVRVKVGGEYHWIKQYIMQQAFEPENDNVVLLGLNIDIDGQKKTEKELTEAKEKAISSDKLKSAFLANMSHEIRTPLNAIVGFSDLLASASKEEEKENYKTIIRHNNEVLLQLINDILDLSKIEADTLEFNWSDVDVNSLLKDLEQSILFKKPADKDIDIHCVAGLPSCVINTERTRVSQVINNFLTNALKFTEKGSITFGYEKRGDELYFYVKDTGAGIPEEKVHKVFDRFVKLDNFKQGTGLGLAICQSIVNKLGGRIGADSVLGEGSTFWFTLPYIKKDTSPAVDIPEQKENAVEEIKEELLPLRRRKLLVAEDMVDNYKLFEIMLAKKYDLVHAWNGEEAISLFLNENPDGILMDIRMPICNGYEATAAIRQMSADIPIIAVTAFAFSEDKEKILSGGFSGYLTKPVKVKELMETLESFKL